MMAEVGRVIPWIDEFLLTHSLLLAVPSNTNVLLYGATMGNGV
jgi:hypothetical protein